MTETQAMKLLDVLLRHVSEDMGNDDVPLDEIGYEDGPTPDDMFSVADGAKWLRTNIRKVELE